VAIAGSGLPPDRPPQLPESQLQVRIVTSVVLAVVLATSVHAADQTLLGSMFQVKDPSTADKRKVSVKAKEKDSPNTIVGDPVSNGATLTIRANGTTPSEQTVMLPQGLNAKGKPFWSGDATKGFKYKDAKGEQGPVKSVQIKRAGNGTFALSAAVSGKLGAVSIIPPNVGTDACALLEIGGGDSYSVQFMGGLITNKDAKEYSHKKITTEGTCVPTCSDGIQNQGESSVDCGGPNCPACIVCGDAVRTGAEQCDDGNTTNLDGCDATCQFEQSHRMDALTMQFATDVQCPQNAFGGAFVGATVQTSLQARLDAGVADGSLSVLLHYGGLDDLTGTTDAALSLGILNGTPIAGPGYDGTNDIDWWYTADPLALDVQRHPLTVLAATLAAKSLVAGPGAAVLNLPLGDSTAPTRFADLQLRLLHGAALSSPTVSAGGPPGHLVSEQLDPAVQSWSVASQGQLCGVITAASLAATPIPTALAGGGLGSCSQNYALSNSLLDVIIGGCTTFFVPQVTPRQPDESDPNFPTVGAGPPYTLSANPVTKVVDTCRDDLNAVVNLNACLQAAAYSSYFTFTTDRVIVK
jgi:cysteine-rich repeat protein